MYLLGQASWIDGLYDLERRVFEYGIRSATYIQPPDVCCSASNIQLSSSREATTRLSFAWTAA